MNTTNEDRVHSCSNSSPISTTMSYLHRMIFYASALIPNNSDSGNFINKQETDGETIVDVLARTLLLAADPSNLILDVPSVFLPTDHDVSASIDVDGINNYPNDDDDNDEEDEEEESIFPPYKNISRFKGGRPRNPTRIDALRSLLRCLAPVAYDVAVRASVRVLMEGERSIYSDEMTDVKMNRGPLQALVLFGFWIGEAPQLAPVISDLFGGVQGLGVQGEGNSVCPLILLPYLARRITGSDSNTRVELKESALEAQEAVVAAEAARELLDHYCSKRYEVEFVRKWWDWDTSLLIMVHLHGRESCSPVARNATDAMEVDNDDDAVMKVEEDTTDGATEGDTSHPLKDLKFYIGGYSPETNAPHCKDWKNPLFQMKWHASRAVGSLFALRSLPLSKFLKRMGVYEPDVPFVRHPWTVMEEETVCEVHRMRGLGRVVLPKVEKVKIKFGCENGALSLEAREREAIERRAREEAEEEANKKYLFPVPTGEDVRQIIPMHPSLIHVGKGILLPRRGSVASYVQYCRSSLEKNGRQSSLSLLSSSSTCFIPTETTMRNMSLIGVAMSNDPHPPPILICGPPGSGKSSLVRELSRQCSSFASWYDNSDIGNKKTCQEDELLELHIDEETDSKTLLGSYVVTDIPGEFVWMAGPLTSAARLGRWVLIEDVDRCPEEIQASLIRLLEERILPLGVGKEEKCHPRFRLFGTCVTTAYSSTDGNSSNMHNSRRKSVITAGSNGKRVLHPNLWRKVHVDPLPFSELQSVGRKLHPNLPYSVADAVLDVLRKLDRSGRNDEFTNDEDSGNKSLEQYQCNLDHTLKGILGHGARHVSVRDYIKLLSRISKALDFEPGSEYATESQRLICLAETVDVFAMSCPQIEKRRDFICQIAAPIWGLTADAATRYIESRIPSVSFGGHNNRSVSVGRARLMAIKDEDEGLDGNMAPGKRRSFAETNHSLRFMESIAVCASANEPALLVGETGCGKTTLVQRLASLTGRELLVLNLSLQTDSTDLLGGYKPLEIRHVARGIYDTFVDLFVSSFSRSQNAQFLRFVLNAYEKGDWKKLAQCFIKAAGMGEKKMRQGKDPKSIATWEEFRLTAERFERQRVASESGMAFLFTEGALVDALRTGKWVLLDEINLASSETLQRLCGLLDDSTGSITLTEKGDAEAVDRHPEFRLFAAMNPATDAGKKDLPPSIRSRFTEIYVDELTDPTQLRLVASRYLDGAVTTNGVPLEHSESVTTAVDVYLQCRLLSEQSLVDGGGQRPRYTMRTLCRALAAGRALIMQQRYSPQRAILEGFELAFEGSLDLPSRIIVQKLFTSSLSKGLSAKERDHPGRRPDGKNGVESHVLIKPFWMKSGDEEQVDWAEPSSSSSGRPKFVLTPSATGNLRRLCQAVASGPWSVLLEGPTSAGKTSLVEYLAKRIGHRCVRINNHEHTDIQEYTGSYAADTNGKIAFQEGILVQALRRGYWVILDELNLAPSEVLEALNRLLDDNRELYLPEINEVVKPHPNFRLFATQNPAGAYGGRKPLSRAFRNRFVEIHMADIPENEMTVILERRSDCPPSHATMLVKVMKSLRQRRSRTGIFRGKDGLVTPRDLLRWAERGATSKQELAREGFMLLAERLRIDEEKDVVRSVIESELKVSIDMNETYYGENSEGRKMLEQVLGQKSLLHESGLNVDSIAPTKSILRLLTLVMRCIKQKEPVLLVGETGCGKTTVVQLLAIMLEIPLTVVNCHASTETSDLLGGFRPIRGRNSIVQEMTQKVTELFQKWNDSSFDINALASPSLDSPKEMIDFLRELSRLYLGNERKDNESTIDTTQKKRRKLDDGAAEDVQSSSITNPLHGDLIKNTLRETTTLYQKYTSLFEWVDGPLVCSMKQGSMLLLDEMSLAEDAVLERLNSVLEPSRTLTLAEKGGEGPVCAHELVSTTQSLSSEVKAHEQFRIFATMNPGGDFGKRELSPALRSRFTEIWVPPVSHRSDIDLVLERSFLSYSNDTLVDGAENLRKMMLDYVDWFNATVCDDPSTFCNDFKLSLRDILSWARFISDVSLKGTVIDQHSAYVHGASLMHLDGIGLGTGISNLDASVTRDKAKSYLLQQIASITKPLDIIGFKNELKEIEESLIDTEDMFGIRPFTIPKGNRSLTTESQFHMTAPTTGMNLRRVLRGMQISKPILLEGSPGVGKTSLIEALAAASGHHLVRINLSEQTDISDLMGNDLPHTSENNTDLSSQATFRWCDGVLLKAIKRGDWVLLDELNLASQSVLEGLNSCLDHRASVYIPELGKSFDCPPSFRIFAAQNPLAQGGGRKGLPKSFLNRFTKVYVEALTRNDLLNIVSDQFPSVPTTLVTKMVDTNCQVQHDIQAGLYGQHGSPWEFNLRDVFRWCQLLTADGEEVTPAGAAKYAEVLYTQRLRTAQDRVFVKKRFNEHLGQAATFNSPPGLTVSQTQVVVGKAAIERNLDEFAWSDNPTQDSGPDTSQSLYGPMEAVALCVRMNWPCLLVGPSSCGKNTILKTLADASNVHIVTLAMSSSTDVTELIGCFEQTDSMKMSKSVLKIVDRIYASACLSHDVNTDVLQSLAKNYRIMNQEVLKCSDSFAGNKRILSAVSELVGHAETIANHSQLFATVFSSHFAFCRQWLSTVTQENLNDARSPFQWVDGTLVEAMERGYWLHLENVNYCPSSVLDRLNPLMEFGGQLVVTECGITDNDQDAKPRVIKPHPNFRLFLSMNPNSHGEVSRAMRNRCIEVCVIPPVFAKDVSLEAIGDQVESIDALTGLWDSGVRSHDVGQYMVTTHRTDCQQSLACHEDFPTIKSLKDWGGMFSSLLKRGTGSPLDLSHQLLYEAHGESIHKSLTPSFTGLISAMSPRRDLLLDSFYGDITRAGRLIRFMTSNTLRPILEMVPRELNTCPLDKDTQVKIRFQAVCRLLEAANLRDIRQLLSFFDGHCCESSSQVKVIVTLLRLIFSRRSEAQIVNHAVSWLDDINRSLAGRNKAGTTLHATSNISYNLLAARSHHLLEEAFTYCRLDNFEIIPEFKSLNVIAQSYYVNKGKIDESAIMCTVTPLLFPIFQTLDVLFQYACANKIDPALIQVMSCRDRFWQYLMRSQTLGISSNQPGVPFGGFIIHYAWLKKSIKRFGHDSDMAIIQIKKQLQLSFETIDRNIEESMGGNISSRDFLWKKGGHPILPSSRRNFEALNNVQDIAKQCTLTKEDFFAFTYIVSSANRPIDANTLVRSNHPCLYMDKAFFSELLGALSTIFWATTDEIKLGVSSKERNACDIVTSSIMQSFKRRKTDFCADLNYATIDTSIQTVENALDLEAIKALGGKNTDTKNGNDFVRNLVMRFGEIQTSQIGEIRCIQDEASIIFGICMVLRQDINSSQTSLGHELRKLGPAINSFVDKFISHTQWSIEDLRPYQTLLWVLDSDHALDDDAVLRVMGCLFPRMLSSFHSHQWCNSYNDLESISSYLQGPSLWNKDEAESRQTVALSPLFGSSTKHALLARCAGPNRVKMNAHRSAMFHLLHLPIQTANSMLTMENGDARRRQASDLLSLFARFNRLCSGSPIDLIKYQFSVALNALLRQTGDDAERITKLLDQPPTSNIKLSLEDSVGDKLNSLVALLMEKIQLLNVTKEGSVLYKQYSAQAWTHLGLLRLHLLAPASPIDPGHKPAAKVEQLDWIINDLSSNILSHSLHSGLSCGDFGPESPVTRLLRDQKLECVKKRSSQEKKIIERPHNSPLFHDLYREVHHFCKTVASLENVSNIFKSIETSTESSFMSQEINWQCSAAAFCNRLSTVYAMYQDVTIPLINEIKSIQRGLRELSLCRVKSLHSTAIIELQNSFLMYPCVNGDFLNTIKEESFVRCYDELLLQFGVSGRSGAKAEISNIVRSCHFAALFRLQLHLSLDEQNSRHLPGHVLQMVNSVLSAIANCSSDESDDKRRNVCDHIPNSDTEQEEIEFREYFPDHGAEFQRIIDSLDEDEDYKDLDNHDGTEHDCNKQSPLAGRDLALAVTLHNELFSPIKRPDDNLRTRAFVASYDAASRMGQLTNWMENPHDEQSFLGSHIFALSLRCSTNRSIWSLHSESLRDFHNDPSPSESIKADLPLRELLLRVAQLLRAFPGHSILIGLGQVVERIRQLDLHFTSLGKVMSGLEVILRRAQDWEQHASLHVQLGKPLKDISALVTSWRKLELQSWSSLLTIREKRRGIRANKHWPRIYSLLHKERSDYTQQESTTQHKFNTTELCPSWVWKGFPKISERLGLYNDSKDVDELAKALDTFILTSNLAECKERLALVKTFANELQHECRVSGPKRLPLARLLYSLWNHYERLMPILTQRKDKLREPIEKRLKDEVKLAKWDEQSYYSLAESSEKNHRKLMKFLRDYDEALDSSVLSILEQNFVEGVRSTNQTSAGDHEPVTIVPGNSSMFPILTQAEIVEQLTTHMPKSGFKIMVGEVSNSDWISAGVSECVDKYVLRISHYDKRMKTIISKSKSWAQDGATCVANIVEAIFSRLESLRATKSTKQVKQRALVDLFKCLNDQGYSSMKWSVPSQIRDSHQLLQLPIPSINSISHCHQGSRVTLEKGESYFHRCLIEISRIRFEISMLGSQYMSQREMTLMQGYSEHMLFLLCQERSMVADMIQTIVAIESVLECYEDITDNIPHGQDKLCHETARFESALALAIEGLRQLILLIKEITLLVDSEGGRNRVRDTITILTGCASKLEESYSPSGGKMPITSDRVHIIKNNMTRILRDVETDVASCAEACDNVLAPSVFESSIRRISQALELALSFSQQTEESDVTSVATKSRVESTLTLISKLVQTTLISAQFICSTDDNKEESTSRDQPQSLVDDVKTTVCSSHKKMVTEWDGLQLFNLHDKLYELSNALLSLHGNDLPDEFTRSLCTRSALNSFSLVRNVLHLSKCRLQDAATFFCQHSKLLYVILRVFRVLVAKGFCSDDVSDGANGDNEGCSGEMKFEDDVEGTGMGEGDGKNDVTDQIENEEQLLGLKGETDQEAASSQEKKELKEDEVDTGMEMEGDFEGDTFDLPEQKDQNKDENDGDNEEEVDREMGDGNDPNEQVVDEKMWDNDEDNMEEMNQEEEKFEDNSKMAGEKLDDEMRTKDDPEGSDEQGKQGPDESNCKQDASDEFADSHEDGNENINDDTEDKYEDSHGVDIRNEEKAADETDDQELAMDLNDGLNIEDDERDDEPVDHGEDASVLDEMNDSIDSDALKNNESDVEDETEDAEESEPVDVSGQGGNSANQIEDTNQDEQEEESNHDLDGPNIEPPPKSHFDSLEELHGVSAPDGQDAIQEKDVEGEEADMDDGKTKEDSGGSDENVGQSSKGNRGNGNDGTWQSGHAEEQRAEYNNDFKEVPNPLRSPGDAEKFWHKKLDIIQDVSETEQSVPPVDTSGQDPDEQESTDQEGVFEYTKENEESGGQVLGVAEEDQAKQLKENTDDELQRNELKDSTDVEMEDHNHEARCDQPKSSLQELTQKQKEERQAESQSDSVKEQSKEVESVEMEEVDKNEKNERKSLSNENALSSSNTSLEVSDAEEDSHEYKDVIEEVEVSTEFTTIDLQQARLYWQTIQSETNNLSRRLCEKLRLVMEPLVATKLRGDYRTGKRVNMKRIIGYIASGYRKDKIWLRRTKPAKRDYRVLIAVDDSESMQKSQAGDMALRALSTLANGMSQLEIGQLGVASFGEEMKLIHPFNLPFTSESGVNVVSNFTFSQKRTRTALCVESSISALESVDSVSSSMQLVFMISDGRIERDSRSKLRRLIRQMSENNMLMVMIIVEGDGTNDSSSKSNESILNMKEVSFVKGKPRVKHFIEDYPFPYYLVVNDLASLPEILGDALRQWFEMMAQIQNVM